MAPLHTSSVQAALIPLHSHESLVSY